MLSITRFVYNPSRKKKSFLYFEQIENASGLISFRGGGAKNQIPSTDENLSLSHRKSLCRPATMGLLRNKSAFLEFVQKVFVVSLLLQFFKTNFRHSLTIILSNWWFLTVFGSFLCFFLKVFIAQYFFNVKKFSKQIYAMGVFLWFLGRLEFLGLFHVCSKSVCCHTTLRSLINVQSLIIVQG